MSVKPFGEFFLVLNRLFDVWKLVKDFDEFVYSVLSSFDHCRSLSSKEGRRQVMFDELFILLIV